MDIMILFHYSLMVCWRRDLYGRLTEWSNGLKKIDRQNYKGMSKLTDFILKRLQENIKQRWVIESKMFFDLLENMGIINDEELLTDIFEFLENENIDVHFNSTGDHVRFEQYKRIEVKAKFNKRIGIAQDGIKNFIKTVDNFKPTMDDTFMKVYMTDDDEEQMEINKHMSTLDNNIELFRKKFEQEKYQKHQDKLRELSTEELIEQLTNNTI